MKKIHLKKPDIKGKIQRLKNLKKEDVKAYWKERKERRARILEERRNSAFAKKMQPVWKWMNRLSLLFHALLACVINFAIEAISRHSVFEAWDYMTETPVVFLYNAFMIFVTFSVVYLFRRRVFARIIVSVLWLILGVANGYMLLKRVTPFNAQDLKAATEGLSLINNYFNGFELIVLIVGAVAVVIWVVSMWRRGGQYTGKMHRFLALVAICVWGAVYSFVANAAVENRSPTTTVKRPLPGSAKTGRLPEMSPTSRKRICPTSCLCSWSLISTWRKRNSSLLPKTPAPIFTKCTISIPPVISRFLP